MRGPVSAYNALGQKDNDTLYFITDSGNNKTLLYLGQNLISDSSNTLSQTAQDFLNNIPTDDSQLNEGDIQVYVIDEIEQAVLDPETGEAMIDPETGEPITEVITEGHWETKSIDELIPVFDGSVNGLVPAAGAAAGKYLRGDGIWANLTTEILPQVLQSIVGDEPKLDEETGLPLYKQEDGTEGIEVTDKPIYTNGLSASYDTLVEIAEWLEDHSTDALDMQSRISALEQATGVNQTETEIRPVVDENDNPVYQQLVDEETGKSQYLDIDPETTDAVSLSELEEGQPVYPAYEENPEGDEPPYIPITDPETGEQLYWDLNEEPTLIDDESGDITGKPPAFVQEMEEVEVSIPNDVEIIKAVIGNLDTVYPQVKTAQIGTLTDRLDILENNFQTIQNVIIGEDNQGIQIIPIGTLESLNEDLHTYDANENDTSSLVNAINMLDERMQWKVIPQEEQNP